jgi:hypothetical protein
LEDDCPQGNDDARIMVLCSLGAAGRRRVECAVCTSPIIVYDRYPLIDGTFFTSSANSGSGVRVTAADNRLPTRWLLAV